MKVAAAVAAVVLVTTYNIFTVSSIKLLILAFGHITI
jgi:hypothetical protein